MDYRDKLIWKIADKECEKITRKVILQFQKRTGYLQSGDDSGLKNIWDEICVQVQGEESIFWETYLDEIYSCVQHETEKLDFVLKQAIWLQTKEAIYFDEDDYERLAISEHDIIEYVVNDFVLSAAGNYHNKRIEKYIWG